MERETELQGTQKVTVVLLSGHEAHDGTRVNLRRAKHADFFVYCRQKETKDNVGIWVSQCMPALLYDEDICSPIWWCPIHFPTNRILAPGPSGCFCLTVLKALK